MLTASGKLAEIIIGVSGSAWPTRSNSAIPSLTIALPSGLEDPSSKCCKIGRVAPLMSEFHGRFVVLGFRVNVPERLSL
jgi:hypothetical protein